MKDISRVPTPQRPGFTIVELLIVIVVIAILASISIVAYSGVTERARYSSLSAGISAYIKAAELYRVEHGEFPHTQGYNFSCLGRPEDYPETADFQEGQCGFSDDEFPAFINDDVTINDALAPYLNSVPSFGGLPVTTYDNGEKTRGVYFDGAEDYFYFEYGMPNNSTCPIGSDTWSGEEVLCNQVIR